MNTRPPAGSDEAEQRALAQLGTLVRELRDRGSTELTSGGAAELIDSMRSLQGLDPAVQRRVARAMIESRGDPAALEAAIDGRPWPARNDPLHVSPDVEAEHVTDPAASVPRRAPRTPTVVDARSEVAWPAVLLAIAAALAAAVFLAGGP